MDIILLDDIEKVGDKHEIVSVKPGYARNYLIPQGMALVANDTNRAKLDEIKQKEAEELAARKAEFEEIAAKLKREVLQIGAKAGTSGKIFGSVTNVQIATVLKEKYDVDVDRRKVKMPEEDIKNLGTYTQNSTCTRKWTSKSTSRWSKSNYHDSPLRCTGWIEASIPATVGYWLSCKYRSCFFVLYPGVTLPRICV